MIQEKNERLEFLDLLKGFAIFLMVMGHFLAWTFPSDVDRGVFPIFVRDLIYSFHMPLFFFVSGYLVDLKAKQWTLSYSLNLLKKRLLTLLIPGFTFLFLFWARTGFFYFEWFLKALFEVYLLFTVIKFISFKLKNKFVVEIFFHVLVIALIFLGNKILRNSIFDDLCSFQRLLHAYPYFFLGYVYYRLNLNRFVIGKNFVYTIALITFLFLFFSTNYTGLFREMKFSALIAVSAIVVCLKLAQQVNFSSPCFITRKLLQWGRITLSIYLVSPLFIPCIPELGRLFILSDSFGPYNNVFNVFHVTSIFLQLTSGLVVTICVCYICQWVKFVVEKSNFLNFICFGEKKR